MESKDNRLENANRIFVEVEDGALINIDLMERVEVKHHVKTATAWAGGIIRAADSHALYQHFFADNPQLVVRPTPAKRDPETKSFVKE